MRMLDPESTRSTEQAQAVARRMMRDRILVAMLLGRSESFDLVDALDLGDVIEVAQRINAETASRHDGDPSDRRDGVAA